MDKWAELKQFAAPLALDVGTYLSISAMRFYPTITNAQMMKEFSVTVGQSSRVSAAGLLVGSLLFMTVGPCIERFGAPNLVAASIAGCILSLAGVMLTPTFGGWAIAVGIINVAATYGEQPTHHVISSTYFRRNLGFAIAAVNTGYSGAGFLTPILIAPLISAVGWRLAAVPIVLLGAVALVLSTLYLRVGPLAGAKDSTEASASVSGLSLAQAARRIEFWMVYTSGFLLMSWEGVIIGHLMTLLQLEAGKTVVEASYFYSFQYVFAILGKFSEGIATQYLTRLLESPHSGEVFSRQLCDTVRQPSGRLGYSLRLFHPNRCRQSPCRPRLPGLILADPALATERQRVIRCDPKDTGVWNPPRGCRASLAGGRFDDSGHRWGASAQSRNECAWSHSAFEHARRVPASTLCKRLEATLAHTAFAVPTSLSARLAHHSPLGVFGREQAVLV